MYHRAKGIARELSPRTIVSLCLGAGFGRASCQDKVSIARSCSALCKMGAAKLPSYIRGFLAISVIGHPSWADLPRSPPLSPLTSALALKFVLPQLLSMLREPAPLLGDVQVRELLQLHNPRDGAQDGRAGTAVPQPTCVRCENLQNGGAVVYTEHSWRRGCFRSICSKIIFSVFSLKHESLKTIMLLFFEAHTYAPKNGIHNETCISHQFSYAPCGIKSILRRRYPLLRVVGSTKRTNIETKIPAAGGAFFCPCCN